MAKRKESPAQGNDNNAAPEVLNENTGEQPEVPGTPENSGGTAENPDTPDVVPDIPEVPETKSKITEVEIPDIAKAVLQQYPNEKELYIDNWGGAFTKGTQPALVRNAILYKNPFYKK